MSTGEWVTRSTALVSFVFWFVVCAGAPRRGGFIPDRNRGLIWLAGALVMLVHIVVSFQVHYQWSHGSAVLETARQTRELTGIDWGGGVWLNYLFSLVWIFDALWRVLRPLDYDKRSQWLNLSINGFLAFMFFNATVVFGSLISQLVGLLAFGYLGVQKLFRRRMKLN